MDADSGAGGGFLVVRHPSYSNEDGVKATVKQALVGLPGRKGDAINVTGCTMANRYSIVELDNCKGIASVVTDPVEAAFVESVVSLTLTGEKLPSCDKLFEVCRNISSNLRCEYYGQSVTLSGCWSHLAQARRDIQSLILQDISHESEHLKMNTLTVTDTPQPSVVEPSVVEPHVPSSSSHYSSITVAPHIMKFLKHKSSASFTRGISHSEGSAVVHFRFNSETELYSAIDKFQDKSNKLEDRIGVDRVNVPQGVHKDEQFALMVSMIEDKYPDTIVTWIDGELKVEIISAQLDEAKADLVETMSKIAEHTRRNEKGGEGSSEGGGAPSWNFKKKIENFLTLPPKIGYQKEVVLNFPKGRSITVRHGDILHEQVDALVNPANEFLSHGAGLAKQIDKASRGAVAYFSKQLVSKMGGRVPTGSAVTTKAGNGDLHCTHVIHAVGPNAREIRSDEVCNQMLTKTVHKIIKEGCRLRCQSIAVPAISSGIFGMKKDVVAEIIIHGLVEHQQTQPDHGYLKDIRVVIWDRETYEPFLMVALGIENSLKDH